MQYPMIGGKDSPSRLVAVPTHFFKVIMAETAGGDQPRIAVAAFVMPNAPIPPETRLEAFVVPLEV
jgi:DNA/RNA endonuclease G (NUC1)